MVDVLFDDFFKRFFFKIRDNLLKEKIIKQIKKLKENPEAGKPMMNVRKGTRELYISSFRLSYIYYKDKKIVEILELYHKKKQ